MAFNGNSQASGSGGVRGASRHLSNALRGITGDRQEGMEVDGGVGRAGGGRHKRTGARSSGPLDQVSDPFL